MGCVRELVDELCKYPGWRRDAGRRARIGPWSARRPFTSANAGGLMACGKIRKAVATVSARDSYPHVTCG